MLGSPHAPFLRLIPSRSGLAPPVLPFRLPDNTEVYLGRDPSCQIVLDSQLYGLVSRQHAKVCPCSLSPSGWKVCDLDSTNGTYVNGEALKGCRNLYRGDRILLSLDGPEFVFELLPLRSSTATPMATFSADLPQTPPPDAVTLSQLFPILSTGRDLTRKAYLLPGMITVSVVVLMFLTVGNPVGFNLLLSAYIAGVAYYFVYRLCGKSKPWWYLLSAMLMTVILLSSPVLDLFTFVFREVLPGDIPAPGTSSGGLMLVQMFFGAGLMEELLKAIPVLFAYGLGMKLRSPWREKLGVWEPLDGILIGTASAVGFTLLETLGQYVPSVLNDVTLQAGVIDPDLLGLQLLIPRVLGSISGHMAYSGYLGYFIGLSVLKPAKRWRILTIGYLTAAVLHTLWNVTGAIHFLIMALVGIAAYAFLAAAILKARALSPTRSQNFATRFSRFP